MNVTQTDQHFLINIDPKDPAFSRKLAAVKKLPGRSYDMRRNAWTIPVRTYSSLNVLLNAINRNLVQEPKKESDLTIDPLPELTIDVPLKRPLYDFQKKGVAYNIEKGNVLIGDQQGLGKTGQAIATVVALNLFPCLVITKKTLILNWKQEFEDWTDKQVLAFTPARKNTWQFFFNTSMFDVGIVNYESLAPYFVEKIEVPPGEQFRVKHIHFRESIRMFKSVIIDESHYVKDGKTKRTKFCVGLTRHLKEKGVFLLSGTPVLNDPVELYTQLTILNRQHLFGTLGQFKTLYSGKHNSGNLRYLNHQLHKHCYYRRTKQDAKADLPAKTRQIILCDIDNREEYNLAERNFIKYLQQELQLSGGEINQKLRAQVMVQMGILKKIAAKGKLPAIREWTNDLLEQEEKVVLFAYHQDIQKDLVGSFKNAVAIASQTITPMDVIQRNKQLFMTTKDHNVIVCSISAASEGHTLNAASNLGMCELPWHFGKAEQCEDRIHRITNWLPANITYFLAEGTIDRDIYKLIMSKKEMHDQVTGGGSEQEEETKVIDQLISLFNQK